MSSSNVLKDKLAGSVRDAITTLLLVLYPLYVSLPPPSKPQQGRDKFSRHAIKHHFVWTSLEETKSLV